MDVSVLDYGAIGDDTHDDTTAFLNALNAIRNTGGTCFVPIGTYKISPNGITNSTNIPAITSDMHLVGEDKEFSILHVHDKALKSIVTAKGSHWSMEKITIQMSGIYETNPHPPPNWLPDVSPFYVIAGGSSGRWVIDNCRFVHTGHVAIVARGTHWTISNSYILCEYPEGTGGSPTHEGVIVAGDGHSPEYTSYGFAFNNYFDGVGWNASGHHHTFLNNTIKNGAYAGIFTPNETSGTNHHSNILIRNHMILGREGHIDDINIWGQGGGWEIGGPYTLMVGNTFNQPSGVGIHVIGHHSVVAFNQVVGAGRHDTPGAPLHRDSPAYWIRGAAKPGFEWVTSHNSIFFLNEAHDPKPVGQKTQSYGFEVQYDRVRCVSFVANKTWGNKIGEGLYKNCQPNIGALKGRDMYANLLDERQREMLRSLMDSSNFTLTEEKYVTLNQLLTGSSLGRT